MTNEARIYNGAKMISSINDVGEIGQIDAKKKEKKRKEKKRNWTTFLHRIED